MQRVMPGMQAAFVDIGLERAAFLHASDIVHPAVVPRTASRDEPARRGRTPGISELVHEGEEIVVQVVKDPIGTQGRAADHAPTIPSRYLVLLPQWPRGRRVGAHRGRSRARAAARRLMRTCSAQRRAGGYIVRTKCRRAAAPKRWPRTSPTSASSGQAGARTAATTRLGERVYEDLSLPLRAMRDLMRARRREGAAWIRARPASACCEFARSSCPSWPSASSIYNGDAADLRPVRRRGRDPARARKEVPLKSGGYLIIDQTEAMTTIDVNTGSLPRPRATWRRRSTAPTSRPRRRSRASCGCATSAASSSSTSST